MFPAAQTLIEAAILAPSGDNLQPWNFSVDDDACSVTVAVDPTRDTSPMNAGQRMARIAVGAATENMVRTAAFNNWHCKLSAGEAGLTIQLAADDALQDGNIESLLQQRCTNRHRYSGEPISAEHRQAVEAIQPIGSGTGIGWILDRPAIEEAASLIASADRQMFSLSEVRRAFLENVRFDAPAEAKVDYGLSKASLGLSRLEVAALPWMKPLPTWLLSAAGVFLSMQRHAFSLARSATGICLITHEQSDAASDYDVGRTMQSVWLELTKLGFALQPMMSLPVLLNLPDQLSIAATAHRVEAQLLQRCGIAEQFQARVAAVLRFGETHTTAVRPGRLGNFQKQKKAAPEERPD